MSLGKLYVLPISPRSTLLIDLVKYLNLDVEIEETLDASFKKAFPLEKTPAFVGPKGFKLHEFIAIFNYLVSLAPESKLLGKNKEEYANVLKYFSFSNSELSSAIFTCLLMVIGKSPYNKKVYDDNFAAIEKIANIFESRLYDFTYLVGERITAADFVVAATWGAGLTTILGKPFVAKFPVLYRWFNTVTKHEFFNGRYASVEIPATPLTYTPPKKEKKAPKEQPKKEAAPKKEAEPAAAPAEAPKPKHPLELLGKPKAVLDEWKRIYSNEETRETAIPWFWANQYDPEEWSLWKVDYKYNDELTLTFMSNNLVGGFFNRLSASTKYMFGCLVVYGENNNNGITGAFLVRGQEFEPAFNVAPDWESYEFTKLDASKDEDKDFINNMFAWDQPVDVNGEKREIADGKVFK